MMKYLPKQPYVRPLGRVIEHEDMLCLGYSCSGITFTFTGTRAELILYSDYAQRLPGEYGYASYIGVYEGDQELCRVAPLEEESHFVVWESETPREVTLNVMKLTEENPSLVAILGIETDGEPSAPPVPERRIEVVGDSITCGYGIEHPDDAPGGYKTEYQNAYEAWGATMARKLNAEVSIMARSGSGVYSSYSGNDERQTCDLAKNRYVSRMPRWNSRLGLKLERDDSFAPQAVVINMGTNDASYTKGIPERQAQFYEAYYEFLELVRSRNPEAHIFCTLGSLHMTVWDEIVKAAAAFAENTGDTRIHTFPLDVAIPEDGSNASCHPTMPTQKRMAEVAAREVGMVMGW